MVKNKTNYSLEFKQSSAKLAVESEQSIAQTAEELGINTNTLYAWVAKYSQKAKKELESGDTLEAQLKRLKKENARLKQERDILKKAAAYFANETR